MSKVTLNLVVLNGEKFIRHTLGSIKNQTFRDFEVQILDNGSTDSTKEIIKSEFPEYKLIEGVKNIGFWAGQEQLILQSPSEYIIAVTDVILDRQFLEEAVKIMDTDPKIGALQAKILQMNLYGEDGPQLTNIIDTVGFQIYHSRRLINRGHGQTDGGQFENQEDIFAVEGAVPIFRRTALEDCRVNNELTDSDFRKNGISYGDDFDLGWRINLFGWRQAYSPKVIAYHDRSTTKGIAANASDYLRRVSSRKQIPFQKRMLDWRNTRFTIIKNDYIINTLKDIFPILWRELMVLGYTIIFEPKVLAGIFSFFRLLPRMLYKRKLIMAKAKTRPREIHQWFL